ncbi:ABC transporter permease subunit [Salipiger thiooxidans]|uniref:ABC transporter permease subunit n=1 Tax=Salipiger thiooxidans TaxID=282683 RepID=UPI0021E5AE59|nr:ABC transporter permease subunit [Salipiger thiooxidans]
MGFWKRRTNVTQTYIMLFVTNAWNVVPFPFIILLAGLQAIPQELHKARAMDGSGPWRRLRDVRLPLLTPQIFVLTPLVFVAITATQSYEDVLGNDFSLIPARHFPGNLSEVWTRTDLPRQTLNSIVVGLITAAGRVALAVTMRFAVVFFTGQGRGVVYALVVASIMLPLRFLWDILLPLSKGPLTALGTCMFISAWFHYMWPLVAASSPARTMAVVDLARLQEDGERIPDFPLPMTDAILVSLPALILIALFQRRIVRGLTLTEK